MVETLHRIGGDVHLQVVITRAYQDQELIRAKLWEGDTLHCNIDAAAMAELMRTCDFAVSAAGGTTNELIRMQCPAVLVPVADNQLNNVRILSDRDVVEVLEVGLRDGQADGQTSGQKKCFGDEHEADQEEVLREMFTWEKRKRLSEKLAAFYSDRSGKDLILELTMDGGNHE
jgi:spore coat polysaccharide biosynthesis predicted glycosyltransferase SpsG